VTVLYRDQRLVADLETPLGLGLYRYGHRDDVLDKILTILHPGDIFIDGGANTGMMTVVAAHRVGHTGRVIALEPAEPARRILEQNVALNGHTNVTILPWALGDKAGKRTFVIFNQHLGLSSFSPIDADGGTVVTVDVRTLDEVAATEHAQHARLVKLDLEGAEVAALRGARNLLALGYADFIVENEPARLRQLGAQSQELFSLFEEFRYLPCALTRPNVLFCRPESGECE
jgi:FkbM family methyltransferase